MIRWIGTLIMLANVITDLLYLVKQEFTTMTYYFCYIGVCAIRILVPLILCLVFMKQKVCGKKPVAFTFDIDQEKRTKLQKDYLQAGVMLYVAVPLTYVSGCFRLLPVKNFAREVGTGFALDFFFLLPLFFIQGLNNATLQVNEIEKMIAADQFQFSAIILKLIGLGDLLLEVFMLIFEVYKLHVLEKQTVDVVVRYSEEKRRAVYSKKFFTISISCLSVIFATTLGLTFYLPK